MIDLIINILSYIPFSFCRSPRVLSPFRGGGLCTSLTRIAMLDGIFTPVRATQARQVEG